MRMDIEPQGECAMSRMQRPFLTLTAFIGLILQATSPARAASLYDFSFSGFIQTAVATSDAGPPRLFTSLDGLAFSALFSIHQSSSGTTGSATLSTDLSSISGNLVGSPNQSTSGVSYSGNAAFLSDTANNYFGSVGTPSFDFFYSNGNPTSDFLIAQIGVHSIDRADDGGILNLTLQPTSASVSPVPLPPALPMFASALLAPGLAAYVKRKREARVRDNGVRLAAMG
jgi:hypothetical protein